MSYNAPKAYWEALQFAGITQIIDVRYKYDPKKFEEQCRKHGISYYYYPVHNDLETIKGMVENYSRFTELFTKLSVPPASQRAVQGESANLLVPAFLDGLAKGNVGHLVTHTDIVHI